MNTANVDAKLTRVTEVMNDAALEALVKMRASPEEEARLEYLGDRANDGLLTHEESQEYQSCVMFANFLGIMQSKALKKLKAA